MAQGVVEFEVFQQQPWFFGVGTLQALLISGNAIMIQELVRSVAVVCGIAIASGCSSSDSKIPEVVPAKGEVTYQDKPVEGADVVFTSSAPDGKPARGRTDTQGKFSLKTYIDPQHDLDGAIPGDYQVIVTKKDVSATPMTAEQMTKMGAEGKSMEPPKDMLPAKYAIAQQSGLKETVKKGQANEFKINLTD